jgi:hypothetical protein
MINENLIYFIYLFIAAVHNRIFNSALIVDCLQSHEFKD